MSAPDKPFFIGFLPVPAGLRVFLLSFAVTLIATFAAVGWYIGATQADPGPGAFRFDFGAQQVTGVVTQMPYPILHVTEGTDRLAAGRSILLSGNGKNGVQGRVDDASTLYRVAGPVLERGSLDMIQTRGGRRGIAVAEGPVPEVPRVDLGRWRLAGEICDGKCLAGAMRPGRGLAHRACANLCLVGGVPPVFVSSQPVEGSEFLLVGGPDGGPLDDRLLGLTALYISVEGQLSRVGDMLVFLIDPETVEVL